jgi:hypothetical protein
MNTWRAVSKSEPEFVKFISDTQYNPPILSLASPTPPGLDSFYSVNAAAADSKEDDAFRADPSRFQAAATLLREMCASETLAEVRISINYASFADEILYRVCVIYKGARYQTEKTLSDIVAFYETMRKRFRGYPFSRLPFAMNSLPAALDKAALGKLEEFMAESLNDTGLACGTVCEFFGFEALQNFRYLPVLLKNKDSSLPEIKVNVRTERSSFEVDHHKNIRIVTRFWNITPPP